MHHNETIVFYSEDSDHITQCSPFDVDFNWEKIFNDFIKWNDVHLKIHNSLNVNDAQLVYRVI